MATTGSTSAASSRSATSQQVYRIDLWRWLMRAWLKTGSERVELASARTGRGRTGCAPACSRPRPASAWPPSSTRRWRGCRASRHRRTFSYPSSQEGWQLALAELATLGGDAAGADPDQSSRLLWVLDARRRRPRRDLVPFEQKRGPRGWGKPREVTLCRLAKTEGLAPRDAAVAVALRPLPYRERGHRLDLAAAVGALVGHPAIELADARGDRRSTLIEGQAELDVSEIGDSVRLRLVPPLRADGRGAGRPWPQSRDRAEGAEALRLITVLRDGPQRARLIRLSPEQKRAAQLIGEQLVVPKTALSQVQAVLQSLGDHFQVHADVAQDSAAFARWSADARLRAELSPRGDALHRAAGRRAAGQRRAATAAGPRPQPPAGRRRRRDAWRRSAIWRSNAAISTAVLDACPMLDAGCRQRAPNG